MIYNPFSSLRTPHEGTVVVQWRMISLVVLSVATLMALSLPSRASAASCEAIVGQWEWFTGGVVTVRPDGTMLHELGNDGTWQCTDPTRGVVTLKWRLGGYVNTIVVSPDGRGLSSADPSQMFVTAKRIGAASSPPVQKAEGEATAHLNRGFDLADEGKYDEAIVEYTKVIEIDPQYVLAYTNRGAAYHDKGQYDQAISDYTKAIELKPRSFFAYSNRADAYYKKGQYDLAIFDYTKTIALNPKDYVAYSNRAAAYYHKRQYDQAISDYTKAIEINPKDADAYSSRAAAYRDKGQYDQAISDASKAIELSQKYSTAYSNRGMSHYRKGDYAKALDDLNKAQTLGKKVDAKLLDELRKVTQTNTQPAEASKQVPQTVTPEDSQEMARLVARISNNYKDSLSIELLGAFKEDKNPFSTYRGLSIERGMRLTLLMRSLSCAFHSRDYRDPRDGIADCDKRRNGLQWTETTSEPIPFPQIEPATIKLSESTGNFAGSDPAISFGYEGYDPMSAENMGFDKNGKPFFILPPGPMRIGCKNRSACEQMAADLKKLVEIVRKYGTSAKRSD